jgi:hypothetical protein
MIEPIRRPDARAGSPVGRPLAEYRFPGFGLRTEVQATVPDDVPVEAHRGRRRAWRPVGVPQHGGGFLEMQRVWQQLWQHASVTLMPVEERRGAADRAGRGELTPAQRTLRARMAAYTLHATHDSRETTRPARDAFMARFEREVDPDGVLPNVERGCRAEAAKRAYFTRLAYKSARARSARRPREAGQQGGLGGPTVRADRLGSCGDVPPGRARRRHWLRSGRACSGCASRRGA